MTKELSPEAKAELERLQAPVSDEHIQGVEFDLDAERESWTPEHAAEVRAGVERAHEADRLYAMTLATIRNAFGLTQVELAKRMQITQGRVSTIESGGDMLLSTLLSYLHAAGLSGRWTLTSNTGEQVEVDLDAVLHLERATGIEPA